MKEPQNVNELLEYIEKELSELKIEIDIKNQMFNKLLLYSMYLKKILSKEN